jgi:hypothetical protein
VDFLLLLLLLLKGEVRIDGGYHLLRLVLWQH